ncbi:hypothetical protein [Methylobacterium sp. AMS5]|uniref:hypothetical protein n=1 Tax=Methylobacterium sp. AMS5 TaxID=925818 RepID=UPI00074FA8EE|nr:hypothetical protein [Methylobacterium sp. AMS5]AMB48233.1 hypothetical protein Y590_25025 [Methylobacterium sp. AMS5]
MSAARAIIGAYVAIGEANQVLKAAGRTPAKVPFAEFAFASRLAKAEVTTCLREPAQQIVTLLRNRSAVLAQEEAEQAALQEKIGENETWGMF